MSRRTGSATKKANKPKADELRAQCPACKATFKAPPARFNMMAFCPQKKIAGRGARGPFYRAADGHSFAIGERNSEAPAAPSMFVRLRIAVRAFWIALTRG